MKSAVFPMAPAARRNRQGMALILTLALLALLSILLVAFVSSAALDRGATASYTQALPADQIALGGLDQVVSQFQSEIADPALSTNAYVVVSGVTNNLYVPLANAYAVPQRTAPAAANLATLISYSGVKLYTLGAGASDYSSSSLTQTPSLNGRSVSTANWNKPQLTTSTANFPSPKWILMTRCGPTNGSSLPFGATTANSLANNSALNVNFAVGRYAYVVYDTSGLLDANVAGYPSGAAVSANGKGLVPWADLTQLSGTITQSDVDNLVNFRNAASASPASSYATNIANAATTNGFTRVANGDTTFLGRQDLIKYATTQNTDLAGALPYLTTFSREANGPTWGPGINGTGATYQYAANQYVSGSFNPRIPNPRVQSTATFTRANGLPAIAGEPLVKYRFPLDKLALLEKFTGTMTLTSTDITNIQEYFGLDLAADSGTMTSPKGISYRHWTYPTTNPLFVHNSGTSGATGIMSLDDVAAVGREPDFFELLQAGILSGSLGDPGLKSAGVPNAGRSDKYPVNAYAPAPPNYLDPDDNATLQIMRIGANIIDQWDADSYPTTITYTPSGGAPISVQGIEDLPYPFAAYFNMYAENTALTGSANNITTPMPPFDFFLYFALWNPHQAPSSFNANNYPANFRFFPFYNSSQDFEPQLTQSDAFDAGFANGKVPGASASSSWFYSGGQVQNGTQGKHTFTLMIKSAPSGVPFTYSPGTGTGNYREPHLAYGSAVGAPVPAAWTSVWSTNACLVLPPLTNFPPSTSNHHANEDGSINFPAAASGTTGPNSQWFCQADVRMVMPVQYQDLNNGWHTYSTFAGIDDQGNAFALSGGTYFEIAPGPQLAWTLPNMTVAMSNPLSMKSDPRTSRFGASPGSYTPDINVPLSSPSGMTGNLTMPQDLPVSGNAGPFNSLVSPYRIDMWASNDSGSTSKYLDNDGILRWGDAHNTLAASIPSSPTFGSAFGNYVNNKPIILNRPFKSVGELGYVYRDMPWKTLDMFSANSADSGLLDLFTLSEAPVLAGRVNLNTPYSNVLASLISGEMQNTSGPTAISSTTALSIANALTTTTSATPFGSRADLVNTFMTNSTLTTALPIKSEAEAVVRSLDESANTRTWNFLIDIVAQSGRYPSTATSLDNFVVEGQRRYWLHVAIDRYTGQIVDKQLEVVNE